MTREKLAGRASMTRELFSADALVGPAHPARGSDTDTKLVPLSYPKSCLEPIFNTTPLV